MSNVAGKNCKKNDRLLDNCNCNCKLSIGIYVIEGTEIVNLIFLVSNAPLVTYIVRWFVIRSKQITIGVTPF